MNKTMIAVAFAMAAMLAVPQVTANHGLTGTLVSADTALDISATLEYKSGNGNAQTWTFTWSVMGVAVQTCDGEGSVEVGFTSALGCAIPWSTGPTGDSHSFPHCAADEHVVDFEFLLAGTATQVIDADC